MNSCNLRRTLRTFQHQCHKRTRLKRPTSVAPMVDITDAQFLELLHIISGDRHCYYSEMHHAQAVLNHRSHLHRFIGKPRDNVVVQLGGNCPVTIAQAVQVLEDGGFAEVNINVGCPSPNVQHGQFGAVLMKAPVLVADILSSINASIPVTVKCRVGVDHLDSFEFFENFVDTLLNCQRPPPHLIVHARKCILKGLSPKQNRMIPPLNYSRVYKLASARSDLPITINGGFTTVKDIQAALEVVDGCMIGRQVMLKPLFLQEIDQHIYNVPKVRLKSPMEVIKQYTDYAEDLLGTPLSPDEKYGLPPFSILSKPLMKLLPGKSGRLFRQSITQNIRMEQRFSCLIEIALKHAGIQL